VTCVAPGRTPIKRPPEAVRIALSGGSGVRIVARFVTSRVKPSA
jgi:hypothetical protein